MLSLLMIRIHLEKAEVKAMKFGSPCLNVCYRLGFSISNLLHRETVIEPTPGYSKVFSNGAGEMAVGFSFT